MIFAVRAKLERKIDVVIHLQRLVLRTEQRDVKRCSDATACQRLTRCDVTGTKCPRDSGLFVVVTRECSRYKDIMKLSAACNILYTALH